jgi:hypothetical protein
LNPRGPKRPQAAWCLCEGKASPGLLPTWLGDPGTERLFTASIFIIVSSRNLNLYRKTYESRTALLFFCYEHAIAAFSGEDLAVTESLVEKKRHFFRANFGSKNNLESGFACHYLWRFGYDGFNGFNPRAYWRIREKTVES